MESYAAERPKAEPEFDRCTFRTTPAGPVQETATASRRMTAADWQALGIERPAVPPLARKMPG